MTTVKQKAQELFELVKTLSKKHGQFLSFRDKSEDGELIFEFKDFNQTSCVVRATDDTVRTDTKKERTGVETSHKFSGEEAIECIEKKMRDLKARSCLADEIPKGLRESKLLASAFTAFVERTLDDRFNKFNLTSVFNEEALTVSISAKLFSFRIFELPTLSLIYDLRKTVVTGNVGPKSPYFDTVYQMIEDFTSMVELNKTIYFDNMRKGLDDYRALREANGIRPEVFNCGSARDKANKKFHEKLMKRIAEGGRVVRVDIPEILRKKNEDRERSYAEVRKNLEGFLSKAVTPSESEEKPISKRQRGRARKSFLALFNDFNYQGVTASGSWVKNTDGEGGYTLALRFSYEGKEVGKLIALEDPEGIATHIVVNDMSMYPGFSPKGLAKAISKIDRSFSAARDK